MKSVPWVLGIGLLAVCLVLAGCASKKPVPNVVGQTREAASAAVKNASLKVGTITEEYSATVAAGAVISQNPAAGASVSPGAVVALTVSKGPQPVIVPNVVGQTQAAASSAVTGAGLAVGAVTQAYSATVAAGTVVSQTPAAGTEVPPGAALNFVVSLGGAPVSVPNVVGQTRAAAQTMLTGAGLTVGTVTEEYHATIPAGQVISHSPMAGASVSPATAVALTVSRGPQPSVEVPDVVGATQAAASTTITGANLTVGTVTQAYSATVAAGSVISQDPAAGMSVDAGSAVALTVSKGPQPPVTVPDVLGQTQAAASTTIIGANLTVGVITQAYSATVASGAVISQVPTAGNSVSPGSAVALTVSKGPQPVDVPDVVGQTQAAATAAITGAGLTLGAVKQVFSASVPSGSVISQSPAAGASVSPHSAVALTVSKGPQPPVTVPDVVGQTQAAATAAITGANLTVGVVTQEYSPSVPIGSVISQSPEAGASVVSRSAVALTLSKGPSVTVPNVVEQARAAASTAITDAGLVVGAPVTEEFSDTVPSGAVISQTPAAGTLVSPGSAVVLTVSKGPQPPATVPNVVGQTQAAASAAIEDASLTVGAVTQEFNDTVPVGLVVSQSPVAGTSVYPGSAVAFALSKGPGVAVPNVLGQTQTTAFTAINGATLTVGEITQEFSETVPSGSVISQAPVAYTVVSPGTAVALIVSKGRQPVPVPNVAHRTQVEASADIIGANLTVGTITQAYSATVPAGSVIGQSPVAGTLLIPGSAVALTVSKGPQVPNVLGQTQSSASAAIMSAGLAVGAITQECSDTVTAGLVIIQSPVADSQGVVSGSAVALVIATGPCNVTAETVLLPGGVPLEMVWITGGSFMMGRNSDELGSYSSEEPRHSVTLGGFWMAKYALTKRQWKAVMDTTPWSGQRYVIEDLDSPAVCLTWNSAKSFLTAVNSYTGKTFRLPSEAEWEYACRAGTTARYYWGDDPSYTAIGAYAWYDGNAYNVTGQQYAHVVGAKLPNTFGLYDMSGNVWQWCQDWYHNNYTGAPTDGRAWESPTGSYRVLRGGSWSYNDSRCRSASRSSGAPSGTNDNIGCRVVQIP